MEDVEFWTLHGIRLLRFFGAACTFVGYVIVVELFDLGVRDFNTMQVGLGLMGLGIPHVLAANQLQKQANFAQVAEPSFGRLLATSPIFPGVVFFLILPFHDHGPNPNLLLATLVVYAVGALKIYSRSGGELTPWDRTFIRWGWLALVAIGLPIMMWLTPQW